jgi:hypothetical protein
MTYRTSYPRDPHWITVRYPGKCTKCGDAIERGQRAFYYPNGKTMYGESCGTILVKKYLLALLMNGNISLAISRPRYRHPLRVPGGWPARCSRS